MGRESGQATVELVAALPALILAGLVSLQLLAVGYTFTLADGAAEAGALALATGRPAVTSARDALPSWAEDEVEVSVRGGRVAVTVVPPAPLRALAERLAVTSTAAVRPKSPSENPRARLAAADTARCGVLSRPNSAAIRPPCVLAPLGPALASRTRGFSDGLW